MGLGRPKVALILTDDERVRLDSLAHRSRTVPHLARRARIILACAEGHDNKVVAKRLRMSQVTVCKWRGRFIRERLDGLYDEPRPGTPRQISDDQIEQVDRADAGRDAARHHTLEQPWHGEGERAGPHDRAADLARVRAAAASERDVQAVDRSAAIEKVRDIVGLYMNPPAHAVVFCVDEKSQIQGA